MLGNAEMPPMDDTCRMCPLPWARSSGSAAWVTQRAPKTLVSTWARASASLSSSIIAKCP